MAGMTTEQLLARLDRADVLPGAGELREATYELLRCRPGDRVLDVGCGGGRAVAELCGRGVRAVGVDRDPGMLAAARARSAGRSARSVSPPTAARGSAGEPSGDHGWSRPGAVPVPGRRPAGPPVSARTPAGEPPASARTPVGEPAVAAGFVEADLLRLPFPDGEFHGYRADKVLHELADPAAAVAEAWRVLAPGGRVVLCGQDWDTLVLDSDRPALTRAIVHARADTIAGPRAARQYRTLLVDAGFTEVAVEVRTMVDTGGGLRPLLDGLAAAARDAGVATPAQIEAWLAEQSARAGAGRFFLAVPIFVASATVPDQSTVDTIRTPGTSGTAAGRRSR
jgi:ubiquinone/menaquinone biosynthesis C-methylase UbiE